MFFDRGSDYSLLHLTVLLLLASLPSTIAGLPRYKPITRSCGARDPSANLTNTHRWLQQTEPLENDLWNATTVQERHIPSNRRVKRQAPSPLYTIDTYMHIIADSSTSDPNAPNYITDNIIRNQFNYLASAYDNASIGFRLAGVDRVTNDTWAANGDDVAMKRALRRGTYASLNIYYQSLLQANANTPGVPQGSTLLGFCTLPEGGITAGMDSEEYVFDGCNVLSGTMPGGSYVGYNLGGTTAHEVGHWNGLLHTFTGNSCAADDFGDYVADTPQERTSTNGCPIYKDSCPASGVPEIYNGIGAEPYGPQGYSGLDPVHNFMDYSSDACYAGFTPGQGARMLNIWRIYREGL